MAAEITGPKGVAVGKITQSERAEVFLEEFRRLATQSGLLPRAMAAIERGLVASRSVRVLDYAHPRGWNYRNQPDYSVQLVATRLALAYLAGNPPNQADVRVTGEVSQRRADVMTAEERIRELKVIGVTLATIVENLNRQEAAEGAAGTAAQPPQLLAGSQSPS